MLVVVVVFGIPWITLNRHHLPGVHDDTLRSLSDVADVYEALGDRSQADLYRKRAVDMTVRILGQHTHVAMDTVPCSPATPGKHTPVTSDEEDAVHVPDATRAPGVAMGTPSDPVHVAATVEAVAAVAVAAEAAVVTGAVNNMDPGSMLQELLCDDDGTHGAGGTTLYAEAQGNMHAEEDAHIHEEQQQHQQPVEHEEEEQGNGEARQQRQQHEG